MKKLFILSALLSLSMLGHADADCNVIGFHQPGTYVYSGPTTCDLVNLPSITVHGTLTVSSSSIAGISTVRGVLTATGSTFSGVTEVSGPIDSSGSVFSSISITDNHSPDTITLSNSTIVKGDITFQGGISSNNKVIVESGSKLYGKVNNGIVINQ